MRSVLLALTLLSLAAQAQIRFADPEVLAGIKDDLPTLPRNLTAEEASRPMDPLAAYRVRSAPPVGNVRAPAEYEENEGLLFRWGSQNALLTSMIVPTTTGDATAKAFVVVSAALQASATTTLQNAGANMSRVVFITGASDSVWIRDYGPRFIYVDNQRAQVDHTYNRPRPNDDNVPLLTANFFTEARYDIGLSHGGGNYHLFNDRPAFMTQLITNENPGLTAAQIVQRYLEYQGLNQTLTEAFPVSFDSTQHIDMWMLPLDERKIILSQYPQSAGTPHTITENLATSFAASGYQVLRTPGWRSSNTHFTYANAVLINSLALVCQFNGFPTENASAISTFQNALPGRTVVPIDCSGIISLAGSLHCITMHVPKKPVAAPSCDIHCNGFE
jgi:agmatine/peptidylarginine deiminase